MKLRSLLNLTLAGMAELELFPTDKARQQAFSEISDNPSRPKRMAVATTVVVAIIFAVASLAKWLLAELGVPQGLAGVLLGLAIVATLMFSIGMLEILLGLGVLLPIISRPDMSKRIILGALTLELLYVGALVGTLLFSSGSVFAPSFPTITAFGYFTIQKLVAVVAALLVSAHRVNDVTA